MGSARQSLQDASCPALRLSSLARPAQRQSLQGVGAKGFSVLSCRKITSGLCPGTCLPPPLLLEPVNRDSPHLTPPSTPRPSWEEQETLLQHSQGRSQPAGPHLPLRSGMNKCGQGSGYLSLHHTHMGSSARPQSRTATVGRRCGCTPKARLHKHKTQTYCHCQHHRQTESFYTLVSF